MATIQNSPLGRSCTQRLQGTQLVDARSEDGREADLFFATGSTKGKRGENVGKTMENRPKLPYFPLKFLNPSSVIQL